MTLIETIQQNLKVFHKVLAAPTEESKTGIYFVKGGGVYVVVNDPALPEVKLVEKIYERADHYFKDETDDLLQSQKNLLDAADALLQTQINNLQPLNTKKAYLTKAAADADTNPIGDDGTAIGIGQLVVVTSDTTTSLNGLYRLKLLTSGVPTWEFIGVLGDLSQKADHGYTGTPKTLKEVDDELVQLSTQNKQYNFQRLFDIYDSSINIGQPYNLSGFQYSAYDVLQIIKDIRLLEGFDSQKKYKLSLVRRDSTNSQWSLMINELNGTTWDRVYYGNTTSEISNWDITQNNHRVKAIIDWSLIPDGLSGDIWGGEQNTPALIFNQSVFKDYSEDDLKYSFQRLFDIYDINANIIAPIYSNTSTKQVLSAFKDIALMDGWDSSKKYKISYVRRNSSGQWSIYISEFDGTSWIRSFSGTITSENNIFDVVESGKRVIIDIDWTKLPVGFSGWLHGSEQASPLLVFNKSVFKYNRFIGVASNQEEILSARFGTELFPCFNRVGIGNIDRVFSTITGAKVYQALSAFRSLKIYGLTSNLPVRLALFRHTTDNLKQLIFVQKQTDGTWSRIFYSGGTFEENVSGTAKFDYYDAVYNTRVVADIDWNLVPKGTSASVEPETGSSIFEVKPECIEKTLEEVPHALVNVYPDILDKTPLFREKLLKMDNDVIILILGDSLSAMHRNRVNLNAKHDVCQMTHYTWDYLMWLHNNYAKIEADRYDSTNNPFSEVGTFTTDYSIFESPTMPSWTADANDTAALTRYSNSANASISFTWSLDNYEKAHFIHRLDTRGTSAVTITVIEGVNKVEVFNGTSWVEANGYVFSQKLPVSVEGSGNSNTLQNWRLKMRRKSGATGIVNIKFTKGADTDYLFYWGVEKWNGNRLIFINLAKGGREFNVFKNHVYNNIRDRKPDLVIVQNMLINEYGDAIVDHHSAQNIINNAQDFIYGDRAGFENPLSLKAVSNNFTDFEVINIIPHFRYEYFNEDGNTFIKTFVDGYVDKTADVVWSLVKNLHISKGTAVIDISKHFKNESMARGWKLTDAYNSSGWNSFNGFTNDTVHQNNLGHEIWAKYISPIFE